MSQAQLCPPQRPPSCCFDRKGFLAVGLGRGRTAARGECHSAITPRVPSEYSKNLSQKNTPIAREPLRRREQA